MAARIRQNPLLAIAVVLGSITAVATAVGVVLVGIYWIKIQNSSPGEAAAFIVSDYGATTAECRDADSGEFACRVTYRGCSVEGRIMYDGPGIYPWLNANPLDACRGYREP